MEPIREPATEGPAVAGSRVGAPALVRTTAMILGYALVAAVCRPLTLPAMVAVVGPGVGVLWIGMRRAPRSAPMVGWRSAGVWLGLGVVLCLWELGALLWGNDEAHPSLSILSDPILATYPGRVAGYAVWLGVGAWLVNR